MKKAIIILMLFLLFTGLMLFKKGLLKPEKINNLKARIFSSIRLKKETAPSYPEGEKEVLIEEEKIIQALKNIQEERKMIAQKKEKLEKLQEHLLLQERELKERADELMSLKEQIEDYFEKSSTERGARIKWLAQVYEKMRAEEVAPIIQKLEDELALEILSQMDQRYAGKILAAMDVERAAKFTQKMGRKLPEKK